MKKLVLLVFLSSFILPSCSPKTGNTKVVKPKYHHRFYDRKKDKKTKRIKAVRVQN